MSERGGDKGENKQKLEDWREKECQKHGDEECERVRSSERTFVSFSPS